MSDIPFLPAAEEEFLEAVAVYEAARTGLGGEFLAEVERAVRRIAFSRFMAVPSLPALAGSSSDAFPTMWYTGRIQVTCW